MSPSATGFGSPGTLARPTLLLDPSKANGNISRMVEKAKRSGVRLRPHFKTHQSADVGEWFREQGIVHITVSSVGMAKYFADHGWRDITIATLANTLELREIDALAERVRLGLVFDCAEIVTVFEKSLSNCVAGWIEVDTGYGRTGIPASNHEAVERVARAIVGAQMIDPAGLITHAGQIYSAGSPSAVLEIHAREVELLDDVRRCLRKDIGGSLEVSIGDTPSCSLVEKLSGADEIRPGNFIFYDLQQSSIGACDLDEIALSLACPVIGVYASRGQFAIYGGAAHLSKDSAVVQGKRVHGLATPLRTARWSIPSEWGFVEYVSQEVGIVSASRTLLSTISVGDVVGVLPAHACLTANLMRRFHLPDGGTAECMPIR